MVNQSQSVDLGLGDTSNWITIDQEIILSFSLSWLYIFPTQITIRVLNSNRTLCGGFTLYYKLMNSHNLAKIQKRLEIGSTESRTKSQDPKLPISHCLCPIVYPHWIIKQKIKRYLGISHFFMLSSTQRQANQGDLAMFS